MNICQLTIFCMLINGMFNIERVDSVNKKLQKSFVEIFGEGWDEEERTEEIGKMAGDWHNDDKQIDNNNDQRETMTVIGDQKQQEQERPSSSVAGKTDQEESKKEMGKDQQSEKKEIIRKWYAIKETIKQRKGKQSRKEWRKIDKVLAKKLGTNRKYIYEWIKELGMGQKRSKETKLAIMRQYWEIKVNNPKMSDKKIAKALNTCRDSIRRWKGKFREELGMEMMKRQLNIVTDEQRRAIVREFWAIKERIKQKGRIYSSEQWHKMENLLAKRLGTSSRTIYRWIKELGMGQKTITNDEKLAIMRQYWEMKCNNPTISDAKIAKALNIDRGTIRRWKGKFGELEMEMKRQLIVITEERKHAIVWAFKEIKERIKQRKCKPFSCKEWNEIENLLAEKLGTTRDNIYKWNKQFGMGQRKMRTEEEKLAIVEQFCEMERNNPKMSARKIAKALNINRACIRKWKCQFGMR